MPPPAKPTTKEEDDFMKTLLADLDDTFFNAAPSSPHRPIHTATRQSAKPVPNASRSENASNSPLKTSTTSFSKSTCRVPLASRTLNHANTAAQSKALSTQSREPRAPSDVTQESKDIGVDIHALKPRTVSFVNKPPPAVKVPSPGQSLHVDDIDMAALLDGAEDWDMDMSDGLDPTVSPSNHKIPCPPPPTREPCTRCIVEHISSPDFSEKRLIVKVDGPAVTERREVILKQDWVYTEVTPGDLINVLGEFTPFTAPSSSTSSPTSTITLTSRTNMLVLHPDLLLSATTVANTPSCLRKPVISALLSSNAPLSLPTAESGELRNQVVDGHGGARVWGNLLHEVVQRCLEAGRWDTQWVEERIEEVVTSPQGLGELVKLGVGIERAKSEIRARGGGLEEFAKRYIGQTVKSDAPLTDPRDTDEITAALALTTLHGIEEDIWSPTYGLKGKLDATVQALIEQKKVVVTGKLNQPKLGDGETRSWTMPFEIKTGRAVGVMEHRAQTMLYTLLVAERYGVEVPSGLLYYTQSKEVMRVSTVRNELRGLVMGRNELASYMIRKRGRKPTEDSENAGGQLRLPATVDDDYKCPRCYVVDGCMLYQKAVEGVAENSSPIASLFEEKTSHLTPAQCDFFKKWEALVSLEEQDAIRFRKELWTMKAEEREKTGRCFANMVVQQYKHDIAQGVARVHQHVYRFVRGLSSDLMPASWSSSRGPKPSTLVGSISVGDAVTVSIEPDLLALARGYVIEMEPHHILVGFDHEVDLQGITRRTRSTIKPLDNIICRIDKDEYTGGMGRIRDNLARLFYANGDKKRLSLVVDLAPPTFDTALIPEESELPPNLNLNQQDAVRKVMSTNDYSIILGMPGTGKTTTIAEIINVLVKRGKTVLLTSYTHSAVDNILLKLKDADYPILRLGSLDKVHPEIHKYTFGHQNKPETVEQLEHQILDPPVVATTCLSVDHALFARRYFDFCIVDEASQVTLPTCLGPLRYAERFVLVGDHFQLPPLVRSREARAGGLDVSLFKRLVDAHPAAVVDLVYQYRMNKDIMLLSNKLIYSDRLRCGSNSVAQRSLFIPDKMALKGSHVDACKDACWMENLLDENCKAVFIDTDMVPGKESHVGELVQNEVEARLVYNITETLLLSGIGQNQIGIISLYRQQIKLLSNLLHRRKGIELLTADKSQGRDKDCIIISMVRSNTESKIGELIKDWRRINVSFTRARSKLIIIGSRKTLRGAPVLEEFFDLMENKEWLISLPPGADDVHSQPFEIRATGSKRAATFDPEDKENRSPNAQRKTKKAKTDQGVLKGRPMLQDVVNDMS